MKKPLSLSSSFFLFLLLVLSFFSCRKINEATTLGDGLVPEVDNINTFEKKFATLTDNVLLTDTSRLTYSDAVALGNISNDPEFGKTNASVYFQLAPLAYKTYPFSARNPQIDSVVLSLDYVAGYGDTLTPQTVRVYEIAQSNNFDDTSYYPFTQAPLVTTGVELGAKTFTMNRLRDSIAIIRTDTVRVGNQLRIRLDDALGVRLAQYDTTTGANGAYNNDTLFKSLFRGFAVKADVGSGNGLAYFNLANATNTRLTVYYKATTTTGIDTAEVAFTHSLRVVSGSSSVGGQVNSIARQEEGNYQTYLNNGTASDDKLYIQSSPIGSAGYISIQGLDTLQNKLIHRAELVVTRVPSAFENFFLAPDQLFLDRVKPGTGKDSAFHFQENMLLNNNSLNPYWYINLASLGGSLRADNTYRFNITKTVQDFITNKKAALTFRVYAPYDSRPFGLQGSVYVPTFVNTVSYPDFGRVVLGGGTYAEPNQQAYLRLIYSNL